MTEPDRLPLRVLVKGASTVVFSSWMGGPRSDVAFPRVIEEQLTAAGWPAEVRCTAVPAELAKFPIRTWEHEVLAWSPDVVILNYGHMECVHLFLPRFLERHVNSDAARPFPLRTAYRKRVLRPSWMVLASFQAALDNRLPPTLLSHRPRRVAADLRQMIKKVRSVASPLVLIPDIPPNGAIYREWFPGMGPRIEVMNDHLRDMVAGIDQPDVRMFPVNATIAPHLVEGEDACPDGGHLTPALHRAVGEAMADVILQWAAEQPHLDLTEARARRAQRDRQRWSTTAE